MATPRPRYLSRRRLGEGGSKAALHGWRRLSPLTPSAYICVHLRFFFTFFVPLADVAKGEMGRSLLLAAIWIREALGYRLLVIGCSRSAMSLSQIIFRDVPIDTWIDRYETSHRDPVNRIFHTFGIPMIAVSIPLFLLAPLIRGFWKVPLSLFTLGWICQFLGHAVEGKPPEFLKDWRFLLVGLRWWLRTIGKQI